MDDLRFVVKNTNNQPLKFSTLRAGDVINVRGMIVLIISRSGSREVLSKNTNDGDYIVGVWLSGDYRGFMKFMGPELRSWSRDHVSDNARLIGSLQLEERK